MTTAGFEDLYLRFAWDNDLMPVGGWLATHIPARVRPPGEVAAYSNYGAMLAGYIVARTSGQPYEQYIQEHIFDPLGMERSTIQRPLPPNLREHASLGYWYIDGAYQAVPVPDDWVRRRWRRLVIGQCHDGAFHDRAPAGRLLR
jgi:CubicO group peptidase (beta-lactamase class C family)